MKTERRQLLKTFCLLPFAGSVALFPRRLRKDSLDSEFVIVNGWVLTKSEAAEFVE